MKKKTYLRLGRVQLKRSASRVKLRGPWRVWYDGTRRKDRISVHSWAMARVYRVGEDELLVHDAPGSTMYAIISISEMRKLLTEAKQLPISTSLVLGRDR